MLRPLSKRNWRNRIMDKNKNDYQQPQYQDPQYQSPPPQIVNTIYVTNEKSGIGFSGCAKIVLAILFAWFLLGMCMGALGIEALAGL